MVNLLQLIHIDTLHLFLVLIILMFFIIQTPESRHFIGLKLRKKNLSFISMNPTGGLKLKKLKWNGKYFECGNEGIFFNFDLLAEPQTEDEKTYNDVLKQASYWVDSRIPVLMGHESICFVSNPQFVKTLQIARNGAKPDTLPKIQRLQNLLKPETSRITVVEPFSPSVLTEYVQSSTAAEQTTSFEMGKITGKLEMTKPKLTTITKFAIPIATIILLLILWQSGALNQLLGGLKGIGQ